jgi:hypothetical protein
MLDMLEKKIIAAPLPAAPVVAAPVEDTILMKMFLASTERADRLMMLLMEQRNAPAAPAGDGLGGLRTAKELVGLADEIRGGAVSSSAAVGGSDVAGILQGLGFLAQVVVAGIKDVYAARAQPMQAASPVTQQFYPQSTPTPIPQPMPTPTPGAEMFGLNLSLVEALRVQVPRALQAFELNVLGADFADALCRTPQGEAHYGVLFDAGIDQLKSMLAMAPQLDAMLQAQGKTRADLDAWLDSFIDYGKDEPESGAGENA